MICTPALLACIVSTGTGPVQGIKLNGPLVSAGGTSGDLSDYRISPDGSRVVYRADQEADQVFELYTVPATGSSSAVKLNSQLPTNGDVGGFEITPDGTHVVFHADLDVNDVLELYAVPIDGSSAPVKISGPMTASGDVDQLTWLVSPDSSQVVYRADQDTDEVFELYGAPIDGSSGSTKLSGPMATGGDVQQFAVHVGPAPSRVVYRADQLADERVEVFSRAIDGSGTAVRLNGTLPLGGDVLAAFIDADGSHVVYRADQTVDERFELFSCPIDGSGSPVQLNAALPPNGDVLGDIFSDPALSPSGDRVVYRADQDADSVFELYSVPIDGSASPVKLSGAIVAGGGVTSPVEISADGARVLYRADQDVDNAIELYSAPIDGSATAIKLNGPLAPGEDVEFDLVLATDSSRVVYRADQDTNDVVEVYSAPMDGSAAAVKLNAALVAGGDVQLLSTGITADSTRVVYMADQETDETLELYSVAIDGSQAPVKLSGTLVAGGDTQFPFHGPLDDAVVFLADRDLDETIEAYAAPIDGSQQPVRLNDPLAPGPITGDVLEFAFVPDGSAIVYRADQDIENVPEIFAVSTVGPPVPVRLNDPGVFVARFAIAPDASRVAFTQFTSGTFELFVAPLDGSQSPTLLSVPPSTNGGVVSLLFSADGTRIVYLVGFDALFVVPADGSALPVELSPAGPTTGGIEARFQLSPDGARVVYLADQEVLSREELYSVPIDASTAPVKLNGPLVAGGDVLFVDGTQPHFHFTSDGSRVTYVADQDTDEVFELYSAPSDGSASAVKLNGPLASGGDVHPGQRISSTGRVCYIADQAANDVFELYSVPADGSASPVKLNGLLATGGDVQDDLIGHSQILITPDGTQIVYLADQDANDVFELFSVRTDGSTSPVKLNGTLVAGGDVTGFNMLGLGEPHFALTPDGSAVVYRADQDTDEVFELFRALIDASQSPIRLGGPLDPGEDIEPGFRLRPAGLRALYLSDQESGAALELFSLSTSGTQGSRKHSGPLAPNGNVLSFQLSGDGTKVSYLADQDEDEVVELYLSVLSVSPVRTAPAPEPTQTIDRRL